MLKKLILGAGLGMGLSCSHILPQPNITIHVTVENEKTERFSNKRSGGRIYFSPEKAEFVGKSRQETGAVEKSSGIKKE